MSVEGFLISTSASLLTSLAKDVVAVYTQDFVQVFRGARPMKASIRIDSKIMEQPLETGATIVDHRIILPVEIDLYLFMTSLVYKDTFDQIYQIFTAGTQLIVQTRSGIYENQFITSIPHEEDPEEFDTLKMAMKLKQALFVQPEFEPVPANPVNNSTKDRGNVNANAANQSQTDNASTLYKWTV